MRELKHLLANHAEDTPLDVAALQLAAIEFPGLPGTTYLELLDSHARELGGLTTGIRDGAEWVKTANEYFFETLGFTGNQQDYYSAKNSCLNEVLLSRTGIPITLSVVYIEVARRLGRPVSGIPMPGHFLAKYDDGEYSIFIDCFNQGRLLTEADCWHLVTEIGNADPGRFKAALEPASKWHILVRMLNNLRGVYYRSKEVDKAIQVLDLLITAVPDAAEEHKQRGMLNLALERRRRALPDLEKYLLLAPEAEDRRDIETYIRDIKQYLRTIQ